MTYQITVTYSPEIIRRATRHFWFRFIAWHGFLVIGGGVVASAALFLAGYRSWEVGAVGAVTLMGAILAAGVYFVQLRRSMWKFARMPSNCVRFTLAEDRFCTASELGTAETSWNAIERIWKFPDVWLLFVAKTVYMILPLAELDETVQSFIIEQVTRHGGRVT